MPVSIVTCAGHFGHRLAGLAAMIGGQSLRPREWLLLDPAGRSISDRIDNCAIPLRRHTAGDDGEAPALETLIDAAEGDRVAFFHDGDGYGSDYLAWIGEELDRSGQPAARLVSFFTFHAGHQRFGHWDQRMTEGPHIDWNGDRMQFTEPGDGLRKRIAGAIVGDLAGLVLDLAAWREFRSRHADPVIGNFLKELASDQRCLLLDDTECRYLHYIGHPRQDRRASFPQSLLPTSLMETRHSQMAAFATSAARRDEGDRCENRTAHPLRSGDRLVRGAKGRPTVCLNMIVRNEAHVIERCLASVIGMFDHWVIVDTGSSDGTQERIRAFLAGIPGELHQRPWVNFGHNRSEALDLASDHADYIFFIDADETLHFEGEPVLPPLGADICEIAIRNGPFSFRYPRFVRSACGWSWKGVLHEYLESPDARTRQIIENAWIVSVGEGARSKDPNKYRRDALVLEQGLIDEPDNARYMFYLAQSYRDCGETDRAIVAYEKRVAMGGWDEEIFESKLHIGFLRRTRNDAWPEVRDALLDAHDHSPHRAEPLFWLGQFCLDRGAWSEAFVYLARAVEIPLPVNVLLFVDHSLYNWRCRMALAIAAFWTGDHVRAVEINDRLLEQTDIPHEVHEQIRHNRELSLDRLRQAVRN
ncbi:MAG: glycosyltransferase family 2 protein [Geminicoccaceae bacterium]